MGGFIAGATRFGYELVPTVMAWATPAGPVEDAILDEIVDEIAEGCRRASVDGLLLALHGAMVARSSPRRRRRGAARLRGLLGDDLPIVTTLDYHANVSPAMAEHADALVGYQTYPHVDQRAIGLIAAELMVRTVREEIRPRTAAARPPMILNLLGQETDREPMRSLMARAREAERRPGMLSVSLMAGFPYADVPKMGPSVIAVADGDGNRAWRRTSPTSWRSGCGRPAASCSSPARVRKRRCDSRLPPIEGPSSSSISATTSAAARRGTGRCLLAELIRQRAVGAVVVLHDPDAVEVARQAGPGGRFESRRRRAGRSASRRPGPRSGRGPIAARRDLGGRPGPARRPPVQRPGADGRRHDRRAATRWCSNSLRTPPFSLGQITSLGIDPAQQAILVVKAAVAYKAAYGPIAGRVIEVDTPGLTAIDPARFAFRHIRRPMFPLDD